MNELYILYRRWSDVKKLSLEEREALIGDNILREIAAKKMDEITQAQHLISAEAFCQKADILAPTRGFAAVLRHAQEQQSIGLIAEVKKASPSKGIIRNDFDPVAIAKSYEEGGACCLSVLTDEAFFQGDLTYLEAIREEVSLPLLRKDFILHPYQILEAKAAGADCILLIMAILSQEEAAFLCDFAQALQLDVLVESHDASELRQALRLNTSLIGINNRNLKTFKTSLDTSITLQKEIPAEKVVICESGINSHHDIVRMQASGIHCFLVGESLMREDDVTLATKTLLF